MLKAVGLAQFKEAHTFQPYRAYLEKQDESQRTLQAMMKKPTFATFAEVSWHAKGNSDET